MLSKVKFGDCKRNQCIFQYPAESMIRSKEHFQFFDGVFAFLNVKNTTIKLI